jgi:NAD(P)-dependent dehydrogenase (short-subunit alcohol dehydrogenase family)
MPSPATTSARKRALVFGGTGTVGAAVVRGLREAGVATVFGWHRAREQAAALAAETDAQPLEVDLADAGATRAALRTLRDGGFHPDVFIHCAAVARAAPLAAISDEDWRQVTEVSGHAALIALQELAPAMAAAGEGHVVLVGALDRAQSLPLPIAFAAAQGALSAITMAAAKELGSQGIRVNLVALGLLEGGLSTQLAPALAKDYTTFSALHRLGQPQEAARAILWLALENTYMSGKILTVNGGI